MLSTEFLQIFTNTKSHFSMYLGGYVINSEQVIPTLHIIYVWKSSDLIKKICNFITRLTYQKFISQGKSVSNKKFSNRTDMDTISYSGEKNKHPEKRHYYLMKLFIPKYGPQMQNTICSHIMVLFKRNFEQI